MWKKLYIKNELATILDLQRLVGEINAPPPPSPPVVKDRTVFFSPAELLLQNKNFLSRLKPGVAGGILPRKRGRPSIMEKAFFSRPAATNPKKLKKDWGLTAQQAQQADVIDDDILEAGEALKRKADEAESDNEEGLVT